MGVTPTEITCYLASNGKKHSMQKPDQAPSVVNAHVAKEAACKVLQAGLSSKETSGDFECQTSGDFHDKHRTHSRRGVMPSPERDVYVQSYESCTKSHQRHEHQCVLKWCTSG